jgi:hypothetical protein
MKPPDDNGVNVAANARSGLSMRLTLLAYLAAIAVCCVLVVYGAIFMRLDFVTGAVLAGGLAMGARAILRRDCVDTTIADADWLDEDSLVAPASERAGKGPAFELAKLLVEWDGLECERGSTRFDPWALQSVRNEIRALVAGDSKLERLFRERG